MPDDDLSRAARHEVLPEPCSEIASEVPVGADPAPTRDEVVETRTGHDWCPNCRQEAGTDRSRDDGGTERCATCGSELGEYEPELKETGETFNSAADNSRDLQHG